VVTWGGAVPVTGETGVAQGIAIRLVAVLLAVIVLVAATNFS
jgi:hypothetical protein